MKRLTLNLMLLVLVSGLSHANQQKADRSTITDKPSVSTTQVNIDSLLTKVFGKQISDKLTAEQAAQWAAELANHQCAITFDNRPFLSSHFTPQLRDGRWHWGALDVTGINGYSATVSFDASGRQPKADVYFSYDSRQIHQLIRIRPNMK